MGEAMTAEQAGTRTIDYRERTRKMIEAAVFGGTVRMKNAINGGKQIALYLYYKGSTAASDGELLLLTETEPVPEGFELATGEALQANVPYAAYFAWLHVRCKRLPILAWG